MSDNVVKYNVWCIEEAKYTIAYGTQTAPPTACAVPESQVAHTSRDIDDTKTKIALIMDPDISKVLITEEQVPEGYTSTGGNIRTKGIVIDIDPAEDGSPDPIPVVTEHIVDLKVHASVLSYIIYSNDTNLKDCMDIVAARHTPIGYLTSSITDSTTVLPVNSTVIENAVIGYFITLSSSPNQDELGYITEIDSENSTITVEFPPSISYPAFTPVLITRHLYENCYFHNTYPIHVGQDKIGGSFVPKLTTMHFIYTNHSTEAKKIYVIVEFLY